MHRPLVLCCWLAGLGAAAAALVLAGHGPLAGPDLLDPSSWGAWAAGRDPVDAAVALVRSAALAAVIHLLGVTLLGLAARAAALPRVVAGLDIAGGPLVRRMLTGAVAAGIAASAVAPAAGAATAPPPTAVMRLLDEPVTTTNPGPATTTTTTSTSTSTSTTTAEATPAPATSSPSPPPPGEPSEYTVRPGDSFWRIAATQLATTSGAPPSDRDIARYWRRLVAANLDRLVVAGQPDLIRPGQRFRLP